MKLFLRRLISTACAASLFVAALPASRQPSRPAPRQSSTPIATATPTAGPQLRALLVGSGPDLDNNQVAIESNIRFLNRILPSQTSRVVLFADGDARHKTVLFEPDVLVETGGQRVFDLLFDAGESGPQYRAPQLGSRLDGPNWPPAVAQAVTRLKAQASGDNLPMLLFFTGHGGPDDDNHDNNYYDAWGGHLPVRELAAQIGRLPAPTPVVLVMVQCYSGAFGNVLFERGDPNNKLIPRDIAGFFASTKDRYAAGCTSAVNEAEYHDFTGYFFAALSGNDRVGRPVAGADFNHDGQVGMDEAFNYTLAHDASIDVPVCTSDVFLRRFMLIPQAQIKKIPFSQVHSWAAPAQMAALDALSEELNFDGEDRFAQSLAPIGDNQIKKFIVGLARGLSSNAAQGNFDQLQKSGRDEVLKKYPALKNPKSPAYKAAKAKAIADLTNNPEQWQPLIDAATQVAQSADNSDEARETLEAHRERFARLCESIVEAHALTTSRNETLKSQFERLKLSEARTLPVGG